MPRIIADRNTFRSDRSDLDYERSHMQGVGTLYSQGVGINGSARKDLYGPIYDAFVEIKSQ